jgi:hypothetical protein
VIYLIIIDRAAQSQSTGLSICKQQLHSATQCHWKSAGTAEGRGQSAEHRAQSTEQTGSVHLATHGRRKGGQERGVNRLFPWAYDPT